MKKFLKKIVFSLLLIFVFLVCLLAFILETTPGLYATIRIAKLFIPGSLEIHHLSGGLLRQFTIGDLQYTHNDLEVQVSQLKIHWQWQSFIHPSLVLHDASADWVQLNHNPIKIIKNVQAHGFLNQEMAKLETIQCQYFGQELNGFLQLNKAKPYPVLGQIHLNQGMINPLKPKGTLDINGTLKEVNWSGEFTHPTVSVKGSLINGSQIKQEIKWRDYKWQLNPQKSYYSPEGTLKISGSLPAINIELNTKLNDLDQDYWQVAAKLKGQLPFQWDINLQVAKPYDPAITTAGLYTRFILQGQLKGKDQGQFLLSVSPGRYQMAKDEVIPYVAFTGGQLDTLLTPKGVSAKGSLEIDPNKKIKTHFQLPQFDLSKGLKNTQTVSGELSLVFSSLDFLQHINPEIKDLRGQIDATLKVQGSLDKMQLTSYLNLKRLSFALPKLGIAVDSLDITTESKKNQWTTQGTLSSAGKQLQLKGSGTLAKQLKGELTLAGSDFRLVNTKEYQVDISPRLQFKISPKQVAISGQIQVPYAQIKTQSFDNSINLSEDVVFKNEAKTKPSHSAIATSIEVQIPLGDKVEISTKGLHATLGGELQVQQVPQGPLNAKGELLVKQGQYKAYGQDLAIEQGQLLYTGGRIDNPEINLRASKVIDNSNITTSGSNQLFDFNTSNLQNVNLGAKIKVGVEVSGHLTAPKILLFSNPAVLSQADILSMLVIGRPASQASKAGGQLLLTAISSMSIGNNGANGAQLLQQLKDQYGFDVNLQTNSNYDKKTNQLSDSTGVVVSKSITKRLQLSYNVGLTQADPNVL
ncbi:MAG: DUF490 domain-containing protein, partial [Legionella sp.]